MGGGGGSFGVRRRVDRTAPLIGRTEPAHRPISAFDATVVLLQPIIKIPDSGGPVLHMFAHLTADARGKLLCPSVVTRAGVMAEVCAATDFVGIRT